MVFIDIDNGLKTMDANYTFKEARLKAGLTVYNASRLLRIQPNSVRRFEMSPDKTSARKAPELAILTLLWYSAGCPPRF